MKTLIAAVIVMALMTACAVVPVGPYYGHHHYRGHYGYYGGHGYHR